MEIIQSPADPSNWGNGTGDPGLHKGRKFVILHGTGKRPTATAGDELAFLQRANAGVSYHFYVTKAGDVYALVDPDARAWHAGSSRWRHGGINYVDLNDWGIGVAFESCNGAEEAYPAAQVEAGLQLVHSLLERYQITPDCVLTHREVSDPIGRKIDPVNFPVHEFREALHGPAARRLPAYHPVTNAYLGDVTIVDDRKVYPGWLKQ